MKFKVWIPILLLLMLASWSPAFAQDDTMVDVGLFFGANSQYPSGIASDQGFTFGYDRNGVFTSLLDLSNYKSLKVYKAGFYENEKLVSTSAAYYTNGNVKGAYTVCIGDAYATFDKAFPVFQQYKAIHSDVFLVYDTTWYLASGNYISEADAIKGLNDMTSDYDDQTLSVMKMSRYQMMAYSENQPIVSFNTALEDFIFKASLFEYNNMAYREGVMFKRMPASDYSVINHLHMDAYLYGVLPKEMSEGWPIEALKAQAVAARNFTLINMGMHADAGFDVCSTTDCQVYGGYDAEGKTCNQAVDETSGIILKYQDEIASCYYHSNSGGETEDVSNIWSGDLPYLKGKSDPYSLGQPNATWTLELTASEIETKLKAAGYNIGTYKGVVINTESEHGRVLKITFQGTNGDAVLLREAMRSVFGYTTVKSMYFSLTQETPKYVMRSKSGSVSTSDASFTVMTASGMMTIDKSPYARQSSGIVPMITQAVTSQSNTTGLTLYGKGYGHGLGMSQWGAYGMANAGMTYDQILTFYYTGTRLGTY